MTLKTAFIILSEGYQNFEFYREAQLNIDINLLDILDKKSDIR